MRSFRSTLALRVGLGTLALALLLGTGGWLFLRARLLSNLDTSLQEIAELESAFGADSITPEFHFRSTHFLPPIGADDREFWAQLLSSEGLPLVLSSNLAAPLPVPEQALRAAGAGRPTFTTQRAELRAPSGTRAVGIRTVIYPMGRTGPSHQDHRMHVSTSLAPYRAELTQFAVLAGGLALVAADEDRHSRHFGRHARGGGSWGRHRDKARRDSEGWVACVRYRSGDGQADRLGGAEDE